MSKATKTWLLRCCANVATGVLGAFSITYTWRWFLAPIGVRAIGPFQAFAIIWIAQAVRFQFLPDAREQTLDNAMTQLFGVGGLFFAVTFLHFVVRLP